MPVRNGKMTQIYGAKFIICMFIIHLSSTQDDQGQNNSTMYVELQLFTANDSTDKMVTESIKQVLNARLDKNTTKTLLRVVTMKEPPFVTYTNLSQIDVPTKNSSGHGVVIEILNDFRRKYNIEFEYVESSDGQWGEEIENGEWSGMIGMLERKEADILAGATIVTHGRDSVVDYSYPFYLSDTGMLIRAPAAWGNRFLIVTAPFKWQVWALTALAIFVSGLVMKGLCHALCEASEVQYTWLQAVWLFFSVFVQQGLPVQPKSWTCRTMLAFWWLAALTLVATFTGNMVALFAVNKVVLPFNTAEDLASGLESDGYTLVTANNTFTRIKFIQASQLPVFKRIWRQMSVKHKWINVSTLEEGAKLVKNHPKLVLIGPIETLHVYASSDCDLTASSNGIMPVMYSIVLQKHSPYTHVISNESSQLVELGLVSKWMSDYLFRLSIERGKLCVFAEGVSPAGGAITIERAQGAFWILSAGLALALALIVLESTYRIVKHAFKSSGWQKPVEEYKKQHGSGAISHYSPDNSSYAYGVPSPFGLPTESAKDYQPSLNVELGHTAAYNSLKHRRKVP